MIGLMLVGSRLLSAAFFYTTSIYCLLMYVPFTRTFIKDQLLSWMSVFVSYHTTLYWLAFLVGLVSVLPQLRRGRGANLARLFAAAGAVAGVALWWHPLLSNLDSEAVSLGGLFGALVPVIWMAAIDHAAHDEMVPWEEDAEGSSRLFAATVVAAPWLAALYTAIGGVRMFIEGTGTPAARDMLVAWFWSSALHFTLFMAAFVALDAIRAVAKVSRHPSRIEFRLMAALAVGMVSLIVLRIALSPISLGGWIGAAVAIAMAVSMVATCSGIGMRLQAGETHPVTGLTVLLGPFGLGRHGWRATTFVWLGAVSATAVVLALEIAPMDWNYLLQKIAVLAVWAMTFAVCYRAARPRAAATSPSSVWLLALALVPLAGYRGLEAMRGQVPILLEQPELNITSVLDRHAGYDASFKILYDMVAVKVRGGDGTFYSYVQRHTNIPHDQPVAPLDLVLSPQLARTDAPKPDVFVIVVDSLRRDYLSPYNKEVGFTPSIASFASESHVFTNAFTHYGATGLSQPSIWTGTMLVHKQYVKPFHPMNSLAKLLDAERYHNYISPDTIMREIMPPDLPVEDLDANVLGKDLDLCSTLGELQTRLDAGGTTGQPVFAYTQPQNIHVSRITREGATVPDGESFPGFYAPYASRVKRVDGCFGRFIQYLKDSGRYEKSIVILTSDHGDSLGESGRWGHAYTLFPEIVRIPMLMHVPAAMMPRLAPPSTLAFSTDITPTLYALLGHDPVTSWPVTGRPLLRDKLGPPPPPERDWHLMVSSYGPVYGILRDEGRYLYVVDAVNYKDYYFDLKADPAGARNLVTPDISDEHRALIREGIHAINTFFKVPDEGE